MHLDYSKINYTLIKYNFINNSKIRRDLGKQKFKNNFGTVAFNQKRMRFTTSFYPTGHRHTSTKDVEVNKRAACDTILVSPC